MERDFRKNAAQESSNSPPSEADLFALAILGKPIPRIIRPEVEAKAKREELKRLAQFSSRHAEEPRTLRSAEAEARHDRELLVWAAQFSSKCESKLRALLWAEAETREAWRRAERFAEMLLEGAWDSSQHPRAPMGQPDGGQWVEKGGGGGAGGGSGIPITTASYSGPKKVDAQHISWPPPIGHHWAPYSVVFRDNIRSLLSDDAVAYAMGA